MSREALTLAEADTLDVFRRLSGMVEGGRNVSMALIADRSWRRGLGLTYDQTNRALAGLVRKGYLEKPARGWYSTKTKEVSGDEHGFGS